MGVTSAIRDAATAKPAKVGTNRLARLAALAPVSFLVTRYCSTQRCLSSLAQSADRGRSMHPSHPEERTHWFGRVHETLAPHGRSNALGVTCSKRRSMSYPRTR